MNARSARIAAGFVKTIPIDHGKANMPAPAALPARLARSATRPQEAKRRDCRMQVFGRRDADTIHALLQPASKKRQGTKSREVCGQRVPRALWGFCRRFGLVEVGLKRSPRSACGEPWWHASV